MLSLSKSIEQNLITVLERAFPQEAEEVKSLGKYLDPQLTPASKPEFGDFQINGALALAKKIKKQPREIGEIIIKHLEQDSFFLDLCDQPKLAGPGFINLTIKKKFLIQEIILRLSDFLFKKSFYV